MIAIPWFIVCIIVLYILKRNEFLDEYEERFYDARNRYWLTHQEEGVPLLNYLTDADHWNGFWIRWWKFWQWDDLVIARPGIHCFLYGYYPED